MHHSRWRLIVAATAAVSAASLALTACSAGSPAATGESTASSTPTAGGEIIVGGLTSAALDPGQLGYSNQSRAWTSPILGSLFLPPLHAGEDVRPGVALGYDYNNDATEFTIHLRDGATYNDGTDLDADSVVWNLERNTADGLSSSQYFQYVDSVTATDDVTVVIKFSQPYGLLPEALAFTTAGYLASPTALDEMGNDAFNQAPVGAGAFVVESVDPGHELVLAKSPYYWDAEHVYLDKVTWLSTGNEMQATLVKLQSGAIQSAPFSGSTTAPAVLQQAEADPGLWSAATAATTYQILPVNTFAAPFDDERARQAIAYCMDRESLADNVTQGLSKPVFVISGADSNFLSGWEEGKALNPYQHDIEKGKALVEQLGGLSFEVVTYANSPVVVALQQQWAECGIDATITVTDSYTADIGNGNYQAGFAVSTSGYNPSMSTVFQDPNTALGSHGFKDEHITQLINEARGLIDPEEAKATWVEIWKAVAELAVSFPIISAPTYVVNSTCLQDVQTYYNTGGVYENAYLSC